MNIKKEEKQKKQIAESITTLGKNRESLEAGAKALDEAIDEAAIEGQNELSEDLIEQQVDLIDICNIIKFVEHKSKTDACIANALNTGLRDLPKALKTCNNLICSVKNIKGISKQLDIFKASLSANKNALNKLRDELLKSKDKVLGDIFKEKKATADKEKAKKIEEAKALRAARIGQVIANQGVSGNKVFASNTSTANSLKTKVGNVSAGFDIDQAINDIDKANGEA